MSLYRVKACPAPPQADKVNLYGKGVRDSRWSRGRKRLAEYGERIHGIFCNYGIDAPATRFGPIACTDWGLALAPQLVVLFSCR